MQATFSPWTETVDLELTHPTLVVTSTSHATGHEGTGERICEFFWKVRSRRQRDEAGAASLRTRISSESLSAFLSGPLFLHHPESESPAVWVLVNSRLA